MVKKSKLLGRLKERWKTGSGMRIGEGSAAEATPGSRLGRIENGGGRLPAARDPERQSSRKLSSRQDALLAMGEGFQELSSLVRGVQSRMDDSGSRAARLAEDIGELPALGRSQLDLQQQMVTHLERQDRLQERLATSLQGVPDTLQRVEKALENAAATEQRTTATIADFRQTMGRIHASMGQMVVHSKTHADASAAIAREQHADRTQMVETLREGQREGIAVLSHATADRLDALRAAQDAHARALGEITQDTGRWRNVIVVLLSLVFVALTGILGALVV